jgi:hypothetical protein
VVSVVVVAAVVGGFGAIEWTTGRVRTPYFEDQGVEQAAVAGAYLDRTAPGQRVEFLVSSPHGDTGTGERWWRVVQAALPPDVVARSDRSEAQPSAYRPAAGSIGVVLARFNKLGYREALSQGQGTVVGPGVLALGPAPPAGAESDHVVAPHADLRAGTLLWLLPALALLLFAAGSGWAAAVLPPDRVLQVALAPSLGVAVLSIAALGWERAGLGFSSTQALAVVGIATAAGWAVAATRLRRPAPGRP